MQSRLIGRNEQSERFNLHTPRPPSAYEACSPRRSADVMSTRCYKHTVTTLLHCPHCKKVPAASPSHVANSFDRGFNQIKWIGITEHVPLEIPWQERRSFLFQPHSYLMRRLWDPLRWPLSALGRAPSLLIPIIAVEVPCRLCLLPLQSLSPTPGTMQCNCTGAPALGCLYCLRCYSRDQNKQTPLSIACLRSGSEHSHCTPSLPEAAGLWSKTLWREADGGMNSAAGPLHARPLPCVLHITSTNASHNWCAGMAPILIFIAGVLQTGRNIKVITITAPPT